MRSVASKFGIPPTTLHDHISGKSSKVGAGGVTVLTRSEEREIALTCMTLADIGYGLTREVVGAVCMTTCMKISSQIHSRTGFQGRIGGGDF